MKKKTESLKKGQRKVQSTSILNPVIFLCDFIYFYFLVIIFSHGLSFSIHTMVNKRGLCLHRTESVVQQEPSFKYASLTEDLEGWRREHELG